MDKYIQSIIEAISRLQDSAEFTPDEIELLKEADGALWSIIEDR